MKMDYDRIQAAMEDVKRDEYDYYLDLETGEIISIPVAHLKRLLHTLYLEEDDEPYEREILFDSSVNTEYQLTEEDEAALEVTLEILNKRDRYVRIPERNSSHAYGVMKSFALTVYDHSLKEELLNALDGPGAFRRFKDVLLKDKKQRKRWHSYNAREMKKYIKMWLKEIGFDMDDNSIL